MKKEILAINLIFLILFLPIAIAQDEFETNTGTDSTTNVGDTGDSSSEPPESETNSEESSTSTEIEGPVPEEHEEPELIPEEDFEQIPEGCARITTETGTHKMECNLDFEEEELEEFNLKDEIDSCNGKFEMIEGVPTCIKKGKAGFVGASCPTQEEINTIATTCQGDIGQFVDESGCSAIMCKNEEFKKQYDQRIEEKYKDDPIKQEAIKCSKDGGKFTLIKGEPRCIKRFSETIETRQELGKPTKSDISTVNKKLENLDSNLDKIIDKFSEKSGEVFEKATEKLETTQEKINELQEKLSEKSELEEEEQREILIELHSLQQEISDVTIGIVDGKMPTEDYIYEEQFNQFEEFYGGPFGSKEELKEWAEKEKSALEMIRNCDKYEKEETTSGVLKSFVPPDPEGFVNLVDIYGVKNEKCKLVLHLSDGGEITYQLPTRVYMTFRGPEDFTKDIVECSGDCEKMSDMMEVHKPKNKEEQCMQNCIQEDCQETMFICMEKNLEKCEDRCGLKKSPEGPEGPEGTGEEEQCIFDCIQRKGISDVICMPGPEGEMNPACEECAASCVKFYEGPCMTEEKWGQKEKECMGQGEHMEAKPIYGDSGKGHECAVDIECIDRSYEFGDQPGTGPGITGQAIRGTFLGFFDWLKKLFGFGPSSKTSKVGERDTIDEIAEDLINLQNDLNSASEDLS